MNKRTTDVVAYLTWVGLLLAFVMGDRENCRFHLNQSLIIWLAGTLVGILAKVPLVGWLIGLVVHRHHQRHPGRRAGGPADRPCQAVVLMYQFNKKGGG